MQKGTFSTGKLLLSRDVDERERERERERKRLCEKKSSIGPMGGLSTSGRRRRRPSNFGFEPFASLKLPIRDTT